MESDQVSAQDGFFSGACDSVWYENLNRNGSCLKLLELLREECTLIHELGPDDITVLHKGVQHGCVALVRFILVDMFDDRGHCKCSLHGTGYPTLTREKLLRKACSFGSTAVNMAVVSGSPKMVLLLEWAIEMSKRLIGDSTEEMSSHKGEDSSGYRDFETVLTSFMVQRRPEEEILSEITSDTEIDLPVPDVKDEDINILDSSDSVGNRKVISVIEGILGDPGDIDKDLMATLKEKCQMDVDFEFVPVAHVILHFLLSLRWNGSMMNLWDEFAGFRRDVLMKVRNACISEDGGAGFILMKLFNILDPRGRTILHVALEGQCYNIGSAFYVAKLLDPFPSIMANCLNTKDGAGRTILHLWLINEYSYSDRQRSVSNSFHKSLEDVPPFIDWDMSLSSSQDKRLNVLKEWCFPSAGIDLQHDWKPIQLAILFNSSFFLGLLRSSNISHWLYCLGMDTCPPKYRFQVLDSILTRKISLGRPLHLAAALGRTNFLEHMLWHHTKFHSSFDRGLGNVPWIHNFELPAIHYAAYFGHVEAIQTILKFPVYDPIIQDVRCGTALHLLLNNQQCELDVEQLHTILLCHLLPNSKDYDRLKDDFVKFHRNEDNVPRMYSVNEVSCINLLLQGGIDIWTPHCRTKELPAPGPMANDDARKWWYDKVVQEVVTVKTSVSYAANATSVVAALVATASFIGPFQPPLGYADSNGYVRTDRSPVRVYLVCNSLSFFFSIASILMAVLPAIPMPKESLYDELLRSQRCLKGAALMLLIAIMCILISFSSASLAVVSSEWRERQMVVACVVCGGVICVVVLVIYMIRMLRMVFHRNDWFRRKFAKYMYF